MIRLPAFTFLTPGTLDEAVKMLADHGPEATTVAGGTDLYPNMKRRQSTPATLVSLRRIGDLRGIRRSGRGTLVIGATAALANVAGDPRVHRALATAAGAVSTPQIRNVGTIGGNLCVDTRCDYINMSEGWRRSVDFCLKDRGETCWVAPRGTRCVAVSSTDIAPVAIALDSEISLASVRGTRTVPAADLYRNDGIDYLSRTPDEILSQLVVPLVIGRRATYRKVRRRGTIDFPVLGVAAAATLEDDGTCTSVRIVLGAIASAPIRAGEAEDFLVGRRLTPDVVEEAGRLAGKAARPYDNTDLNSRYRRRMVPVHVGRALQDLTAG